MHVVVVVVAVVLVVFVVTAAGLLLRSIAASPEQVYRRTAEASCGSARVFALRTPTR
jgi:hypothetical protein